MRAEYSAPPDCAGAQAEHQVALGLRGRHRKRRTWTHTQFSSARQTQNRCLGAGRHRRTGTEAASRQHHGARPSGHRNHSRGGIQRDARHGRWFERRRLLTCVQFFSRLETYQQASARTLPGVAIGSEQVQHNARDRRLLLILLDADGGYVLFLNRDPLLSYSQARVRQIDDQARRRIQSLYLRNDRPAGQNFNYWNTAFMNDANTLHQRRRAKGLSSDAGRGQRHQHHQARRFERTSRQKIPAGTLKGNISLAVDAREVTRTAVGRQTSACASDGRPQSSVFRGRMLQR